MKRVAVAGMAAAAMGLSALAWAQPDGGSHAQTEAALRCLLMHARNGCQQAFVGNASRIATPWLWWNKQRDFNLGPLLSSDYAGNEPATNPFITKFLDARAADVYDVKFAHMEETFYIVPPGPDGKVRYLLIRGGAPSDEAREMFLHGPG